MIFADAELYNVEDVFPVPQGEGMHLSRIPNELRCSLNETAKSSALGAAGSEIRFNLERSNAKIALASTEIPALAEVYQGSFMVSSHVVAKKPTEIAVSRPGNLELLRKVTLERDLPFDPDLTRIILPYWPATILIDISGEFSPPREDQTPKDRLLAYGSSITHGAFAQRPTGTYPFRLSQVLGIDHLDLGFGGGAHCEGQLADYIARRSDWTMATLEIGINMVPNPEIDTEEFRKRVKYFLGMVAGKNPDKWVFCIDMFMTSSDLDTMTRKYREFRRTVRDEVRELDLPKLVHVDGRKALREPTGLSFDLVHPSSQGMEEIALSLSRIIRKRIPRQV